MIRRIFLIIIAFLGILTSSFCQGLSNSQKKIVLIRPEICEKKSRYSHLPPAKSIKHPSVALVLSGGGARGVAAIGVLRELEKNDIPVDLIVGTSMGSVIGGLYAMGYTTDQLKRMVDETNWEDLLSYSGEARRRDMFLDQKIAREKSILVLRFKGLTPVIPEAFSTGQRLTSYLNSLVLQALYKPDPSFDDLRIPFKAVTTDLVTGKRIVIDHGDMTEALRASLAIPLLFSSVPRDTLQLLDGGLVDNLPVDVALANKMEVVVAVDMVSPLRPRSKLTAPWEIADQITTIMMQETIRLAREKASLVIKPELGDHLPSDFTYLDSLILLGETAARESISKLKEIIEKRSLQMHSDEYSEVYKNPRFSSTGPLPTAFLDSIKACEERHRVSRMDIQRLVNDIYDEGDYASVEAKIEQYSDSTIVGISLAPNRILNEVKIFGNRVLSPDTLQSIFRPMIGQPLSMKKLTDGIERLTSLYREAGYAIANVLDAKFDSTSDAIEISIDEGVVARTDIRGTIKTRDWVVRRELPWRNDSLLTEGEIDKAISNLYGTSYFDQVRLSVHHEDDTSSYNIITVHARERSTELIRFGLRIDDERNIQPSIDLRDENLLGAGAEIGIYAGGGTRNQSYIAEIKATRIFNTYLTFSLKGYALVRDVNAYGNSTTNIMENFGTNRIGEYREMRNGGVASFGAQLERLGSVTVEGRLEKLQIFNIFNTPITNQEYNISSIRFGTNLDTQDKVPYPTDGMVVNFFYESALVKLIEAVGFTKMYFSYDKYISLGRNHVLHPRFAVGVADEALPLSEEFSFGDQHNFFGFREDNARGRQLLAVGMEYQMKLPFSFFFDTYLKARYDFGSVWPRAEGIRLDDFKHGIGATLGFDTPIGPAEFSIGRSFYVRKNISDKPVIFDPFVAYFSIGYPINGSTRN